MRLAFLGSPPFAEEAFAALVAGGFELAGLVTAPPRRAGRGRRRAANPLRVRARDAGLPVLQPESARDPEFQRAFADWGADLGVVVAYGQILDDAFLALPTHGCVNLHASLLPRWRGASPVQAAILAGDRETGVCVQKVVRELDAGAVLAERRVEIGARETAPELAERLARHGAELLVEFLRSVGDGPLPAGREQDPDAVTVCRRVRKEDGWLDWTQPAEAVDRRVRAMAGWPGGQTVLPDGTALTVHAGAPDAAGGGEGAPDAGAASEPPGTVLAPEGEALPVTCGRGRFLVSELQRAGRARMPVREFLRGCPLPPGTRLGGAAGEAEDAAGAEGGGA